MDKNSEQPAEVTQADRAFAASVVIRSCTTSAQMIVAGDWDDSDVVQVAAAVRIALSHRDIPPGHVIVPEWEGWGAADEADPSVVRAREAFKPGDRVTYTGKGWVGTVRAEESDAALLWCDFDGIGCYGADPRKLNAIPKQG